MSLSKRHAVIFLLLILVFGAILRLQAVAYTQVENPIRADATKYVLCAYNLKYFGTYTYSDAGVRGNPVSLKPDAFITPGFPIFLMPFLDRDLFQMHYVGILFTQALLSTLTILMAYFLFAEIAGKESGLLAATLTALSPHLINMNVYLLTEPLFCFFLVAFFMCFAFRKTTQSTWLLLLAGMLLGTATLVRPWTQGFIVILLIYALTVRKLEWRRALLLLGGFSVVILPWVLRNELSLGMPSDPTLSLVSMYHGSFPNMMWNNRPETLGFPYHFDPRAAELSSSFDKFWPDLMDKFHHEPWEYAKWYLLGKVSTVFSWSILGGVGDVFVYPVIKTPFEKLWHFRMLHDVMQFLHNAITCIGLLGCLLVWLPRNKQPLTEHGLFIGRSVSLLFLYFIILHIIGAPFSRYSIPMRPFVYGMAVVGGFIGVSVISRYIVPVLRQKTA